MSRQPICTTTATVFDVRRSTHGALRQLGVSLAQEFAGRLSAGTVISVVGVSRERLLAAGVREGLVVAVESMTRARLERLAPGLTGLGTAPLTPDPPALAVTAGGRVR